MGELIKFPMPERRKKEKSKADELLGEWVEVCYLKNETEKIKRLELILIVSCNHLFTLS